jgi:hypothetical protein
MLFRLLAFVLRLAGVTENRTNGSSSLVKAPPMDPVSPYAFVPREPFITVREPRMLSTRELLRLGALGALLTLIPAILVGLISNLRPDVYGGRVEIFYDAAPASTSPAQIDREFATQEIIVRSRTVLGPVAQKTEIPLEELEDAVDVDVLPGTQVLQVTVGDRDAARAEELAQAVAETYIGLAITQATRQGARTSEADETRLERLTSRLSELEADAAQAARRGQVGRETALRTEAADVLRSIGALRDRLNLVPGSSLKGTPRVFVPAHVLPDPIAPKPLRAAAGGAVVGALIAAAAILLILRGRTEV